MGQTEKALFFPPVLRSRHFFGRLRLRRSEVLEPTPAPTKLVRLWLLAKKGSSRRLRLHIVPNIFHFELLKSELLMQVFFGSHLLLSHVLSQQQGFPILLAKRCSRSRSRPKKAAPALGSGQQKNRLRLHPKSGGSRRLRLCNTAFHL